MRIIAGEHKGRKLLPPKGDVTRPITDRVKTALFSILTPWMDGALVLDLFSGTGSMGLEALSRGAARCFFAERDRTALERLERNIQAMRVGDRCDIWRGDILKRLGHWLAELDEPIDVAFVDPPYPLSRSLDVGGLTEQLLTPLASHLASDGLIVFRCEADMPIPKTFGPFVVRDRRTYGTMALVFIGLPEVPRNTNEG